eukprot:sb/3469538/
MSAILNIHFRIFCISMMLTSKICLETERGTVTRVSPRPIHLTPRPLTRSAKLTGTPLTIPDLPHKSISQPVSRNTTRRTESNLDFSPLPTDFTLSTVSTAPAKLTKAVSLEIKSLPQYRTVSYTCKVGVSGAGSPRKNRVDIRLPYKECLTSYKSPRVQIMEVECITCGQLGSLYRHRADKTKCGRCGKFFTGGKKSYRVTKTYTSDQVKERFLKYPVKVQIPSSKK